MAHKENLLEGFEMFEGKGRMTSPDYALMCGKTCRLTFSSILVKKLEIEKWQYVLLAIQRKTKVIALKRCNAEEYAGRAFRHPAGGKSKSINMKGFVKYFKYEAAPFYEPKISGNILILTPLTDERSKK